MTLDEMTLGKRVCALVALRVWPGIEVPCGARGTITAVYADDSPSGARHILLDERVAALDHYNNVVVVFRDDVYGDDPVTADAFAVAAN